MAGALAHFAGSDPEVLDTSNNLYTSSYRKAYVIGLVLPDLAKDGIIKNEKDLEKFFEGCEESDIITQEEFELLKKTHHFNPMENHPELQDPANPNLEDLLSAPFVDITKPIWRGVFCHLCLDKGYYYKNYCTNKPKAMQDWVESGHALENWYVTDEWRKSDVAYDWYHGFDILNRWIEDNFHIVETVGEILSPELLDTILKGFHVTIPEHTEETPKYMNVENIKKYIFYSRLLARHTDKSNLEYIIRFFDERDKAPTLDEQDR